MNTTLKNIAEITSGYPFRGKIVSSKDGVPVIQMKDIKGEKVQWESISRSDANINTAHFLQENDLLCAGKAKNNYFILLDSLATKTICSPHFFRLRIRDQERILPQYLNWFLNSNAIQNQLKSEQMGTTTFSIRKEVLQKLEIPIPPANEQTQLVALAQTVAAQTLKHQRLIVNNHQLMNGIAQQLFNTYGKQPHE